MARLTLRKRERYGLSAKGAYISSSLDAYEIGIIRRSTRHRPPARWVEWKNDSATIAVLPRCLPRL